jgi:4-alpha-glucanotransferase
MKETYKQYELEVAYLKWQQFQLNKRWQEIKAKASAQDILLFGDIPIFIGHDSADVWAHPEWFMLDQNGMMTFVTGVPPDYFSETGQRWGNPHYDWEIMKKDHYSWWRSRIHHQLECFDLLRIDHFRGMEASWMIDSSCETAVDGYWQKMPGDELLSTIKFSIDNGNGQLPFVAEDLGVITPEVDALRNKYNLPGMSILQFGFDEFDDNPHKVKNIKADRIVYTGTHDNDTTKGWFNNLDDHVKKHVLQILGLPLPENPDLKNAGKDDTVDTNEDIRDSRWMEAADLVVEKMMDEALLSRACICIFPMQDCLHLGSEARMNTPGTIDGNWTWKFQWNDCDHSRSANMRKRIEEAKRLINPNKQTALK